VLIVEHDIDRVLGFSQRVTVMNQGEVLMAGTPDQVRMDKRVQEVYTGTGTPPVTGRAEIGAAERQQLLRFEKVNAFYGKSTSSTTRPSMSARAKSWHCWGATARASPHC